MRCDQYIFGTGSFDLMRKLAIDQAFREVPIIFVVAQSNTFDLVKGAQYFFIGLHAQRAQEDGTEKLAFTVDAHVENVLGMVFELYPKAPIVDDLSNEITTILGGFIKHALRRMQMASTDAL